ncbi:hypothetical protein ACHAW5_005124 [Stephanodiscus triporus]|uniref:Sugar phosphate transporter domain-containing protein n=1 Tax=Stephanodiscus triporus TaxID=2934178 RepID=A0ABD3MKV2_9STRA
MPSSSHDGSIFYVPLCFALWYALNVAYNVTNKWALNDVRDYVASRTNGPSSALPLTIGCLQFGVGSIYSCVVWASGARGPVPHAAELSDVVARVRRALRRRGSGGGTATAHAPRTGSPPSPAGLRGTLRIAVYHTLGQLCTILCLSSNSIGFAHVIKAMEPLFSALASRIVLGQTMDTRVYLSLVPVVGGVVLACSGSDEFSWTSFWYGMGSNFFFAMRAIASKVVMDTSSSPPGRRGLDAPKDEEDEPLNVEREEDGNDDVVKNSELGDANGNENAPVGLSPANLFGAVTCASLVLSIPLALIFEGGILTEIVRVAVATGSVDGGERGRGGRETIFMNTVASGLFHYLNNEVMYLVLSNVHPITLAVGNTMKRVFIIMAGVLVFATPVSFQTAIGSAIAIGGVFVYSLMKQWYGSSGSSAGACGAKIL